MKVIFDFDDVVFDTKRFKETIFAVLDTRGYRSGRSLYNTMRTSGEPFSLLLFISHVTADSSEEHIEAIYEDIVSKSSHFVNNDVVEIMKNIGKENCYIVTHGDEKFQRDKIRESLGEELVQEVVVVSGSKADAIKKICKQHKEEDVIFVDDKLFFINDLPVSDCVNLKTVLFNEHGLENLKAEIADSEMKEVKYETANEIKDSGYEERQKRQNLSGLSFGMH
jgi:FMN phosphatase YigB (HAD superfamily)